MYQDISLDNDEKELVTLNKSISYYFKVYQVISKSHTHKHTRSTKNQKKVYSFRYKHLAAVQIIQIYISEKTFDSLKYYRRRNPYKVLSIFVISKTLLTVEVCFHNDCKKP